MMLLALTRRPLRSSQISQGYWPAVWVSLAEARACSPSLLTISTSMLATAIARHVQHALGSARQRLLYGDREPLVAIGEGAHQHRQVDSRDAFDAPGLQQLQGDIAGRGAVDVGEHQHAVALVELLHQ